MMKDDKIKIEQRLQYMKDFYLKAGEIIDNLPKEIPAETRNMIKKTVLGDKDLKQLMDGIDAHRPPRIFLIGRTGVGKSSLINALFGTYVAKVSDTTSCTRDAEICHYKDGDRILMDIMDTRGIAESNSLDEDISAEKELIKDINEFSPDVAIMMLNCTHRDDISSDVAFMKKVAKNYYKVNKVKLPIVVVVNKCDEMAPARMKNPSEYNEYKISKIKEMVYHYKSIIMENNLWIDNIIAVSSLIEWQTPDGMDISVEDIEKLPQYDKDNLQIAFDGRYGIEELLDILEKAIPNLEAQMGLRMAARLDEVIDRMVNHLITIFSGISATVALTPIPVSDIYILIILQAILVCLIASLSGRDISLDTGREFILSMGGVAGAGYTFRFIAQQSTKLLNGLFPGSGSVISSAIASTGTTAIGKAAVSYYIEGNTIDESKLMFNKLNKNLSMK